MPNVDSRIVRVVLDHLRETFGSGVDEAFEDAGMHPGDLDGGAAWVSSTFLERFYENVAEQQTGDTRRRRQIQTEGSEAPTNSVQNSGTVKATHRSARQRAPE